SRAALGRLRPNPAALARLLGEQGAVYAFTTDGASADVAAHARMFGLMLGADAPEDPATGSAAGPLGAYLVRNGARGAGRLVVEQGRDMGRPSHIEVDVTADGETVRGVRVGGGVVRIADGRLLV